MLKRLLVVVSLIIFAGSLQAQQPVPSEKEAREEVARQKREWQEKLEQEQRQQQRDYEAKIRLLLRVLADSHDPEMRMLKEKIIAECTQHLSPSMFDGVQWERCRTLRCAVRG